MSLQPAWKAVGGKRWLAEQLAAEIAATNPAYYAEPFVGAGAVALALPQALPKVLADTNSAFVAIWEAIKVEPERLFTRVADLSFLYENTNERYLAAREAMNSYLLMQEPRQHHMQTALAAHALFVVSRCFNGLWRTNRAGKFNVPWGKYKHPRTPTFDELRGLSAFLRTASIRHADFRVMLNDCKTAAGRLAVYADPPYHNTFDGYTEGGFDEEDQRDLASWLKYLSERGAKIWSTNSDTDLIREIYSWARVEPLTERHSVGATGARRGQRNCVLIRSL